MRNFNKTHFQKFLLLIIILIIFPVITYADSSWIWISETRPVDILPMVVIITLVIEIVMIFWAGKEAGFKRVSVVVIIANLTSFLIPFFILLLDDIHPFPDSLNDYHAVINFFTVLLTFFAEVPIVYILLGRHVENEKKLRNITILANLITTVIVIIIEKTLCEGEWC